MNQDPGYSSGCATSVAGELSRSYIEEIPLVGLPLFMDHYMPQRMSSSSPATITQAVSQRWRFPARPFESPADVPEGAPLDLIRRRWTKFPVDPNDTGNDVSGVYSGFAEIFDQIVACCIELEPGLQQRAMYFDESGGLTDRDASVRI
ncbi:hypothetical protein C8Q78DRAFT_436905 [Trametes maxima]|nr:hypothetical protein C8Q78DRAFT_436905 [Trametes maxima]